jgi:hypothetical protein
VWRLWQDKLHIAHRNHDPSAQVGKKLLQCNGSPQSNCPAKTSPGLAQITVSTMLRTGSPALRQRSTVDTALEISSNEPAIFRLPMSNHKEEGGFVSKRRIIGLIYLADRLHLRYLYRTLLTKCIVEQFDE